MTRSALRRKLIKAGRGIVGDCSISIVLSLDTRALAHTLDDVVRCCNAGLIDEDQALLFARVHWALAGLKASNARGFDA